MRIEKINVYVVKIPNENAKAETRYKQYITEDYYVNTNLTSTIYSDNNEFVLVKLTTTSGIEGYGEILAPTSPEVVAILIKTAVAPLVLGHDAMAHVDIWHRILNSLRVRGYSGGYLVDAIAGIDMALWDIKGKAANLPVYKLLGGKCRNTVPCYISYLNGNSIKERLESIEKAVAQGHNSFKVHKMGDAKMDIFMLEAIRKKYDKDKLNIGYDAHWVYSHGEACVVGKELDNLDIMFFEAPVKPEDIVGHKKVADAINTSIADGENLRTLYTFNEWIKQGALELIQPDIGRVGVTDMIRISSLAEANHLDIAPHLSVHQMMGFMATLHVSFAIPNLKLLEYQPIAMNIASEYSQGAFRIEGSNISIIDKPGLGVNIDFSVLKKYIGDQYELVYIK